MKKFRTILVGFGKVAQGIYNDRKMSKFYKFQCHAQVLKSHPCFDWVGVVDPDEKKLEIAKKIWKIKNCFKSVYDIPKDFNVDILVIATKPIQRLEIIKLFPSLKGAIIEKPICLDGSERNKLVNFCKKMDLKINVNFNRRFDNTFLTFKKNIKNYLGNLQFGTIIYGNGLRTNGIHFIDQLRMLLGEIKSIKLLSKIKKNNLIDDFDAKILIKFNKDIQVYMCPINFQFYREQLIDLWGEKGRLEIIQEGLLYRFSKIKKHRALENINEIATDTSNVVESKIGLSYYNLYDDLVNSLNKNVKTNSPIENAKINEDLIDRVYNSQ